MLDLGHAGQPVIGGHPLRYPPDEQYLTEFLYQVEEGIVRQYVGYRIKRFTPHTHPHTHIPTYPPISAGF
jgi:hypothetical protein